MCLDKKEEKSLYSGKSNMDAKRQNNKKSIIKFLRLMIQDITRKGKMKKESGLKENVSSPVAHTILTKKKKILSLLEIQSSLEEEGEK